MLGALWIRSTRREHGGRGCQTKDSQADLLSTQPARQPRIRAVQPMLTVLHALPRAKTRSLDRLGLVLSCRPSHGHTTSFACFVHTIEGLTCE